VGQDGLAEKEENERSGSSVWMNVRQKGRGAEDHVWMMSVTGKQEEESERVMRSEGCLENRERGVNG
jgi:hypothetical protein